MAKMIITGAAGFIGNEAWRKYEDLGWEILGIDNLSRPTAKLPDTSKNKCIVADACDIASITNEPVDVVLHLSAQTSVTQSVIDPETDFNDNLLATLRVCLWAKEHGSKVIFSSTNKVFGELVGCTTPVDDDQPLNPQTPYGISKCAAACYVRDILPDKAYVFHQSCIYGESQVGTVDQGWVGWLRTCVRNNTHIVCYGDGTQVRDLLHVNDLLNAYDMAISGKLRPDSYVIGGGPSNAFSVNQVIELLGAKVSRREDWRPHDQRYFVSANRKISAFGWKPQIEFKGL